jgi:hypothetical protein
MDDIGQLQGHNDQHILTFKAKEHNECVILIPELNTAFTKYMMAFHQEGLAISEGMEHIGIFSYPFMGRARIAFHDRNEFYNDDPFYFLLMSIEKEDAIKTALKKGFDQSIPVELVPANEELEHEV